MEDPEPIRVYPNLGGPVHVEADQWFVGTVFDDCDGIDNDEDGQLDEDYASTLCFEDGCPGATLCHFGRVTCSPVNCEPPPPCERPVDIVVIFDRSPSMRIWTAQLTAQLSAIQQQATNAKWWVIDVPGNADLVAYAANTVCHPGANPPINPCVDFQGAMADIASDWFGGTEPQRTALSNLPTFINWTPGADREAWVLSDEQGQGAPDPVSLAQRMAENGITVKTWTQTGLGHIGELHSLDDPLEGVCE